MANNSKFDSKLERMQFLMEYNTRPNEVKRSNRVEYHTLGADDKVYGILKEGNMYYIMTTEQGKENLAESYSYINGYNYRNENGYKSYNEATKQLELKMISLNEAYHKHKDVSTVDFNRGKKTMATLTEAARKELNRMHEIFENSQTIGKNNTGDPESKGSASAENTTKNNAPFEKKAEATLDKDPKFNATVKSATPDNKEVGSVDSDLQSDKMKTKKVATAEQPKDAHDDLDGEGVADKKPSGAKAVKMNEAFEYEEEDVDGTDLVGDEDVVSDEFDVADDGLDDFIDDDDEETSFEIDLDNDSDDDIDATMDDFSLDADIEEEPITDDGEDLSINEQLEQLLEEFEETEKAMHGEKKSVKSKIVGPDKVMDGPHGGLDVQGWNDDKINEAVNRIAESVAKKLCGESKCEEKCQKCGKEPCECGKKKASKKNKTLQESINRIVAEEITRLNDFGKHPRYRKEPMTTPANKEVLAGTAEKDWNDDSTKGNQPYGQKIGKGDPFEKVINLVMDNVKAKIQESRRSKKA